MWGEVGMHPPMDELALDLRPLPGRGLGYIAKRDIEEGEILLVVPLKHVLCAPVGPDSEAELAAALLQVLGEGPRFDGEPGKEPVDEMWAAYTAAAFPPAPCAAALTWSDEDIERLGWPPVVEQLKSYRAHLQSAAESTASFTGASIERAKWAVNAVVSRSFGDDTLGRVLAPFADLFNDRPMAPAIWAAKKAMNPEYPVTAWTYAESETDRWFMMRSMGPVEAGREVNICYGEGSHAEVLAVHGYLPQSNDADFAKLFDSPEELVKAAAQASGCTHDMGPRLEMLTSNPNAAASLAVRAGGLNASAHLLSSLEVVIANEEDLPKFKEVFSIGAGHAILRAAIPDERHKQLRKQVIQLAGTMVAQRLAELPPTSADEEEVERLEAEVASAAEGSDSDEKRRLLAARFRLGLKGLLTQFVRRTKEDEPDY